MEEPTSLQITCDATKNTCTAACDPRSKNPYAFMQVQTMSGTFGYCMTADAKKDPSNRVVGKCWTSTPTGVASKIHSDQDAFTCVDSKGTPYYPGMLWNNDLSAVTLHCEKGPYVCYEGSPGTGP